MMDSRTNYWGITLKITLTLGIPLAITLIMLSYVLVPVSQEVMFDHEMTDLADETMLHGARIEDQAQSLMRDFTLLARKLEEGNSEAIEEMVRKLSQKYALIEILEPVRADVNQEDSEEGMTFRVVIREGRAVDPDANEGYRAFLKELRGELDLDNASEQIITRFRKPRLQVTPTEGSAHEIENHVFWVGGRVVPAIDGVSNGRVLVMGKGFDDTLSRLMGSPRHMAILLDHEGHVVLNPFDSFVASRPEGEFVTNLANLKDPFEQGTLYKDASEFAQCADWATEEVLDFSLPTLNTPEVLDLGIDLPEEETYYYWESLEGGFTPEEITVIREGMRRLSDKLAHQEWNDLKQDWQLERVGGLSPTVSTLRILAADRERVPVLRDYVIEGLTQEFEQTHEFNQEQKDNAIAKLKQLQQDDPQLTSCWTIRFSGVQIPLSYGPETDTTGFVLLRGVFEQEVRAALDKELNFAERSVAALIILTFATLVYSGRRIGKLLERMSATAESISTLTFDDSADVDTWQEQSRSVSSSLPTQRMDELGVLSRSLQRMLVDILNAHVELRKLNAELEERVQLRTDELRQANQELEVANEELKRGRDEAEQLSRSKDEFLASVSHELRNPLNWLHGSVQFLEMTELDEQQNGDVQTIRRATEELGSLIEDILDYQKIVMKGMPIEISEVELQPLLEEVWDSLKLHADKHGAQLDFLWSEPTGVIETDSRRFKQIIKNLAGNSCKFRDPEGKRPNHVVVNVERFPEWLSISVSDTGRGMKQEEQEKLFVKFQKLSSHEGNKSGTGLGLVITKSLVELMGGSISFESEFGVGTTFHVELPIVSVQPSEGSGEKQPPSKRSSDEWLRKPVDIDSHPLRPAKVMVIDDDPKMQEMMTRYLTDHGYDVISAIDGLEALALVKKESPDLITLDVKLPELDGWAVLAALKTDVETADVPVIMTTTLDDREKGMSLGADEYLVKPVDWTHLERVISQFSPNRETSSVLIIEDEEQNRALLRRQLEAAGWEASEAENGRAALEYLEREKPALILLDLMMPVMDGFEFLVERQKSPELLTIPVIVVTAKELSVEEVEHLRGSVIRVMQKGSYSQTELLSEIRQELERRRRMEATSMTTQK